MKVKLVYIYIIISIIAVAYLVYLYYQKPTEIVHTVTEYIKVPEPHYIYKVKKVEVPVERVVTLEKEKIVEKEKLPDWLAGATDIVVLAVGEVKPYIGRTKIISILNTRSGEGGLIYKQEPLSFLEFRKDLSIEVNYDALNHEVGGRIRFTFLRLSKVYFHGFGEGSLNEVRMGVGIEIKF